MNIFCGALNAQNIADPKPKSPAVSEIVATMTAMNESRTAAMKAFRSERTYELDYSGFPSHKHAKMVVDVQFKAPKDRQLKVVSEEGSELLRNKVLHKLLEAEIEANDGDNHASTALSQTNYSFTMLGREEMDGRDCFVLRVEPRTKSKFLYDGKIWVDTQDFAVVHIIAQPAKNPSFWIKHVDIEHRYQKVGIFWLPLQNKSDSTTRLGGHASLSIDYGSYQLDADKSSTTPHGRSTAGRSQSEDNVTFNAAFNWSDPSSNR